MLAAFLHDEGFAKNLCNFQVASRKYFFLHCFYRCYCLTGTDTHILALTQHLHSLLSSSITCRLFVGTRHTNQGLRRYESTIACNRFSATSDKQTRQVCQYQPPPIERLMLVLLFGHLECTSSEMQ